MHTFTAVDVARATKGSLWPVGADAIISAVVTDSRSIRPGELFVALRGERFDGHTFVPAAVRSGAAAVLMEAEAFEPAKGALTAASVPAIVVSDTLSALQLLANWYRSHFTGPVIGVTGSNGKTTTKDLIAAALSSRFPVHATRGNLNNEIGVPLTILQLQHQHRGMVVEMGMRASGEIRQLAEIARPSIGVVTNVGPVHLETLADLDGVAAAKAELVEQLPAHGFAVLNADDPHVRLMADQTVARVITFGLHQPADVRASDIKSLGFDGSQIWVQTPTGKASMRIPLLGEHNVSNALAAIAVAEACGLTLQEIAAGLRGMRHSAMRMEVLRLRHGITLLNDAYNASPASMRAAFETLRMLPARRRGVVLGDMLELGEHAQREHELLGQTAAKHLDRLIVVGRWAGIVAAAAHDAGLASEAITICQDAEEAARAVTDWVGPHDLVVVKASRGLRLERVVDDMVVHFGMAAGSAAGPDKEGGNSV